MGDAILFLAVITLLCVGVYLAIRKHSTPRHPKFPPGAGERNQPKQSGKLDSLLEESGSGPMEGHHEALRMRHLM